MVNCMQDTIALLPKDASKGLAPVISICVKGQDELRKFADYISEFKTSQLLQRGAPLASIFEDYHNQLIRVRTIATQTKTQCELRKNRVGSYQAWLRDDEGNLPNRGTQ